MMVSTKTMEGMSSTKKYETIFVTGFQNIELKINIHLSLSYPQVTSDFNKH